MVSIIKKEVGEKIFYIVGSGKLFAHIPLRNLEENVSFSYLGVYDLPVRGQILYTHEEFLEELDRVKKSAESKIEKLEKTSKRVDDLISKIT